MTEIPPMPDNSIPQDHLDWFEKYSRVNLPEVLAAMKKKANVATTLGGIRRIAYKKSPLWQIIQDIPVDDDTFLEALKLFDPDGQDTYAWLFSESPCGYLGVSKEKIAVTEKYNKECQRTRNEAQIRVIEEEKKAKTKSKTFGQALRQLPMYDLKEIVDALGVKPTTSGGGRLQKIHYENAIIRNPELCTFGIAVMRGLNEA